MKKALQLILAASSIAIAAGQAQAVIFTFGGTPDASGVSPISVAGGFLTGGNTTALVGGVAAGQTLADNVGGSGLVMTFVSANGNISIDADNGLGISQVTNAWSTGDVFTLSFNQDVVLEKVWLDSGGGGRLIYVQPTLDAGSGNIALATLNITSGADALPVSYTADPNNTMLIAGQLLQFDYPVSTGGENGRFSGIEVSTIPEPATLASLFGLSVMTFAVVRRRRYQQALDA